jgi:heme A synthase
MSPVRAARGAVVCPLDQEVFVKRARKMLGLLATSFAILALSAATPAGRDAGTPVRATVSGAATTLAAPTALATPVTTQQASHVALTAPQMEATVGNWSWSSFIDGLLDGAATVFIIWLIVV